jgi:hypothetical protein
MKTKFSKYIGFNLFIISLLLISSCKKENNFLNAKPNAALAVPQTLNDLKLLLHNEGTFNIHDPALGEISSDDFYLTSSAWTGLYTSTDRNAFVWAKQIYDAGANIEDWNLPYKQVYTANTILEELSKIIYPGSQQNQADQIKGCALFYRAIAFYNLLQTFALPYDARTAGSELGIPLRLSSDLNKKVGRAPEQECYDQIIQDLITAVSLLPEIPPYKTQPSKSAANALLSRVYLALGNYSNALQYATACLNSYNSLTDYNSLVPSSNYQLSTSYLAEDIYHSVQVEYDSNSPNYVSITDSTLYRSYTANDLRKSIFFVMNGHLPYFRGTYDTKGYPYSGIATDEVYLIKAECNARLGNTAAAMTDLNNLLIKRWKNNTFLPYTATSSDDALTQILMERRKELLYRGLRWTDLRRLNKDSRFAVTLSRNLNKTLYTLPPNDSRYALPIPDNEIQLSGIPQNIR